MKKSLPTIEPHNQPLVSVCIPLYNKSEYIHRTIKSLLNQTYSHIEIVISDNASNDGSEKIVQEYANKYKNIKLFRLENTISVHENWRYNLLLAKGEFITLLCADDYLEPDFIEKMVNPLLNNPHLDFTVCKCQAVFDGDINEEAKKASEIYWNQVNNFVEQMGEENKLSKKLSLITSKCLFNNYFGVISNYLFRNYCYLDKENKFDGFSKMLVNSFGDWEFLLRLNLKYTGYFVNSYLGNYSYNQTGNILSQNQNRKYAENVLGNWLMPLVVLLAPDLSPIREFLSPGDKLTIKKIIQRTLDEIYQIREELDKPLSKTYIQEKLLQTSSTQNQDNMNYISQNSSSVQNSIQENHQTQIFLFSNDPGVGGVAEYNNSLVCGLAKSGYIITYIQPLETSSSMDRQKELGIKHIQWNEQDSQLLIRLLNEQQPPDLIICSNINPFSNLMVKDIAIQFNIPYLVVEGLVEPHLAKQRPDLLAVLSHHYRHAKAVIAVSQDNLNLLRQLFGLAPNHGEVIHCGRPSQYFTAIDFDIRSRLRQELNIPGDAIVCLTAARIELRKGYQYQIKAIKQLINTSIWNKLYFVWIGGGIFQPELETELKQTVANLSIEDKVIFLGQISNVGDWLNIADIFVFPSELEGMPLCVMEAMAKGLPVIASAVSGIPEELGETGKLIADPKIDPQTTIEELVTNIENLAHNPELRLSMGQACKQRAEKMFQEEKMITETLEVVERALLPNKDYVSPGLKIVKPDKHFPSMIAGNVNSSGWPYLRREIPHNWYIDQRYGGIGFLSRDEANLLYNIALQFKGKKALEIGCWMGWSACHLALAGLELDVIDPLLANETHYENVKNSLVSAGVFSQINLVAGYSPEKVEELAHKNGQKWSLIFIDGNHDAPGPLNDAITCEKFAEDDALIIFHDLASPDVAQGLDYFQQKGWNTLVYQTMQIMGIAWRGNIDPLKHTPDPNVFWTLTPHLSEYQVSEWQPTKILSPVILIDGVFFQLYKTGIARVWKSLLEQWANTDFSNHILVLDRANTAPKINGIRYRSTSPYNYNDTESDRQMLQQICDEEGAELFISTYYTTPINTPSVFMAYDMIPEVLGGNLNEPMWIEKHNAIKYASAFISISENTARDLSTFFPNISLESITVAHCGVDPLFSPASENEINAFKYKYGINKPYFLSGGLGGYKNEILFLQAFSQLINKHSFDIVATGAGSQLPPEWRQYTAGCTFHGLQLSDAELRLAYAGAVALVYPSQYEGFGMPVAEAMACGCPVITTRNASLPEVGGEAVIYVKDDDIEGMTNALCDVQKPSLRRNLIQAGLQQYQKFSWDKMADIVSNVLVSQTLESLPFNLGEINLIMFPDWNQSEDDLYVQLGEVIKALATDSHADETTLLIYVSNSDPETADGILSSIAMNLIMEDEIDITESIQISLIEEISEKQWQTLIPHLQSRVVLELENQEAIAKFQADTLPTFEIGL